MRRIHTLGVLGLLVCDCGLLIAGVRARDLHQAVALALILAALPALTAVNRARRRATPV
jgi:hypothetical protein